MNTPSNRSGRRTLVAILAALTLFASACGSSSPKSGSSSNGANPGPTTSSGDTTSAGGSSGAPSSAPPATLKTLTLGTSGDFPPYEFRGSSGDVIGFIPDMLKIVLPKLGYTYKYTQISFSGLPPALASGRIDMITALYDTPDREKQIAFADFAAERDAIIVRVSDGGKIKGWADLCGKTVGAIVGSPLLPATVSQGSKASCESKGQPAIKSATYQSDAEELRDLQNGRIDAGIDGSSVYGYAAKQSQGNFVVGFVAGAPAIAGWGLKKGSALLPKLTQGLEQFLTSSEAKAVATKWGLPDGFFLPHAKSVP